MPIPLFLSSSKPTDDPDDFNNLVDSYLRMLENSTSVAPVGSSGTATTRHTEWCVLGLSSPIFHVALIVPRFIFLSRLRNSSLSAFDQGRICSGRTPFSG